MQLYTLKGAHKYLTAAERDAFLAVADRADRTVQTLCMTLAYSGCRLSQALALTVARIDLGVGTVVFESLEKRRDGVYRAPRVIGDALSLPKAEQIAAHPERLKRIAPQIWTESGDDPRWDGIHVDGAYWIKRNGGPIELDRRYEGGWGPV